MDPDAAIGILWLYHSILMYTPKYSSVHDTVGDPAAASCRALGADLMIPVDRTIEGSDFPANALFHRT